MDLGGSAKDRQCFVVASHPREGEAFADASVVKVRRTRQHLVIEREAAVEV
jgi:hypothetical protein